MRFDDLNTRPEARFGFFIVFPDGVILDRKDAEAVGVFIEQWIAQLCRLALFARDWTIHILFLHREAQRNDDELRDAPNLNAYHVGHDRS